jgi:hypothetical protein
MTRTNIQQLTSKVFSSPHLTSSRPDLRTVTRHIGKYCPHLCIVPQSLFIQFLEQVSFCVKCNLPGTITTELLKSSSFVSEVIMTCMCGSQMIYRMTKPPISKGITQGWLEENLRLSIIRLLFSPVLSHVERFFAGAGFCSLPSLPIEVFEIVAQELQKLHDEESKRQMEFLNLFDDPQNVVLDTQWNRPQKHGSRSKNASSVILSERFKKALLVIPTSESDLKSFNSSQKLINSPEDFTELKCLEKLGTREGLIQVSNGLSVLGTVCHDRCSTTTAIVLTEVRKKHPQVCDCLDSWHVFKSIVAEAKNVETLHIDILHGFTHKVRSVLRALLLKYPTKPRDRRSAWTFFNWKKNFHPGLTLTILEVIRAFTWSFSLCIEKLVPFGTSIAESYNNHNLSFFVKKVYYTRSTWRIKMFVAFLQWNNVFEWVNILLQRTLPLILNTKKSQKTNITIV